MYRSDGTTPAEQLVDAARAATVCDTVQRAQEAGLSRIVIGTPEPERFMHLVGVEIDVDDVPRSFADRLRTILDRHPSDAVCYAGTGMPLMVSTQWASLLEWISSARDPVAITNNLYSTDLIATTAVQALSDLSPDATDNSIGLYLRDSVGVDVETLPRSAATLLDIDTPAELRLLALAEKASAPSVEGRLMVGPALRAVLAAESEVLDLPRITTAVDSLTDQESQILVVGRVGSEVWQALETQTASRVRVIAEERGMCAARRSRPRTLLGFHLDATGPEALVSALEELADAVFLDTRPLLGHLGWNASRADRFAVDLGQWETVQHPQFQQFAQAVAQSHVPIVLGGHALVSGGLLAAIDIAWARWKNGRAEPPSSGFRGISLR